MIRSNAGTHPRTTLARMHPRSHMHALQVGLGKSTLDLLNGLIMVVSWYYLRIWGYVIRLAMILYR